MQDREDLSRATGASEAHEDFISNLSRISQLTGMWPMLHCSVRAHPGRVRFLRSNLCRGIRQSTRFRHPSRCALGIGFSSLQQGFTRACRSPDVLLVNQTPNTLQNLCLDFATLGDLKLVERPSTYTIAPHSFQSIKATIKVNKAFYLVASILPHCFAGRYPPRKRVSSLGAYYGRDLACPSSVSS